MTSLADALLYSKEAAVLYARPNGQRVPAVVVAVHFDDASGPYYTIRLADSAEKQTDRARLAPRRASAPRRRKSVDCPGVPCRSAPRHRSAKAPADAPAIGPGLGSSLRCPRDPAGKEEATIKSQLEPAGKEEDGERRKQGPEESGARAERKVSRNSSQRRGRGSRDASRRDEITEDPPTAVASQETQKVEEVSSE